MTEEEIKRILDYILSTSNDYQKEEGIIILDTFRNGIIPSIKRRLTGQISGMAGAYGNVGAVFYLFIYTFVEPNVFFYIIAGGAFIAWLVCFLWLEEPDDAFGDEYKMSSVDIKLAEQDRLAELGK